MLDEQTLKEIAEYEAFIKAEEEAFIQNCNCRDSFEKWNEESWRELSENADYYNDCEDEWE